MNGEELMGIISHECGHILCRHTLYSTMFKTLTEMGSVFGVIHRTLFAPSIWLCNIGTVNPNCLPTVVLLW